MVEIRKKRFCVHHCVLLSAFLHEIGFIRLVVIDLKMNRNRNGSQMSALSEKAKMKTFVYCVHHLLPCPRFFTQLSHESEARPAEKKKLYLFVNGAFLWTELAEFTYCKQAWDRRNGVSEDIALSSIWIIYKPHKRLMTMSGVNGVRLSAQLRRKESVADTKIFIRDSTDGDKALGLAFIQQDSRKDESVHFFCIFHLC